MASRYEIGKELGKGSFATVNLCRRKSSDRNIRRYFAIKVINVTECKQQQGASNCYDGAPNNNNRDNDEIYNQSQPQNLRSTDIHDSSPRIVIKSECLYGLCISFLAADILLLDASSIRDHG